MKISVLADIGGQDMAETCRRMVEFIVTRMFPTCSTSLPTLPIWPLKIYGTNLNLKLIITISKQHCLFRSGLIELMANSTNCIQDNVIN